MAAFTEGFDDVSGGAGKGTEHLGKAIGKILEARQLASDERRYAEKELFKQAPHLSLEDFGIDKGYFFKKALQHEFGGAFIDKKKNNLKKLLSVRRILKSKKKIYVTAVNFLRDNTRFASVDSKRAASFRKKFNYKLEGDESSTVLEDSSKKVAKAASGSSAGPKTKQDFLVAVTEIAKSLQSTAQSINNAVDQNTGIASGIVSTQKNIVVEISHRTDRVTDKLEAIAAAVNQQTEFLKRAKESAEVDKTETRLEGKNDVATTDSVNILSTKTDESKELSTSEEIDQNRPPDPWGTAEKGAIIDGPKEGYNVNIGGVPIEAHGTELVKPIGRGRTAIVPLDNYATDGIQGNEVTGGGDLAAEQGMLLPPPPLPPLDHLPDFKSSSALSGLNLPKAVNTFSSSASSSGGGQSMINALELPFKAVGASIIKITGDIRNRLGAVSPAADGKLSNIMNIVANAFGLSSEDIASSKASSEANSRVRASLDKQESKDDGKWYDGIKNFIGNITEKTGNLINSGKSFIGNAVNNIFGRNKKEFNKNEIAVMLVDEFKKQGFSQTGAQLAAAELMRETGLDQGLILGSHDDGGVEAFGAGSWQGGREDALFAHLKKLGINKDDIANSGEKGIRGNASFLVEEIANRGGGNVELMALLKKPNLSKEEQDRVRQLFKDAYFVYAESIPLDRSENALRYIMKTLGVQLDTSSLQSLSTNEVSSNDILENLNLGSAKQTTEIAYLDLGIDGSVSPSSGFTDSQPSGRDTMQEGSRDSLGIESYYFNRGLNHV
tara:strand:+ start:4801 stop:7140 length:2340 start_codon:yes stop_codon:yes gene_type:complete